ncbi:hypothetical protein Q7C_2599 [Methylophaga frappieri]|uniref:Uncharacterized protein n=1 Tax=Methylophaga frappieri (strain ATCC BAA-2434 / DSM 25690 / JAM7) TaxID=754477 RepID=I1YLC7_METFJ|nr:hypothetical protein Q7C_2599 [Methylophaga frappieri]
MTLIFFIMPGFALLLKKYYFVRSGRITMNSRQSKSIDMIAVPMILIYNVYFLYHYFS